MFAPAAESLPATWYIGEGSTEASFLENTHFFLMENLYIFAPM